MTTVADMTLEDLRHFIEETLDERLTNLLGTFEVVEHAEVIGDSMTWDEIRAIVRQHRWTPPVGARSSLDLLREDREK